MKLRKRVFAFLLVVTMCICWNSERSFAAYDEDEAVEYARKYGENRNTYYQNFEELGGDCTNFVSQCLYAGGLPMSSGYSNKSYGVNSETTKWYHARYITYKNFFGHKYDYKTKWIVSSTWARVSGKSYAWGLAEYLGDDHLGFQERRMTEATFDKLLKLAEPGDIIQLEEYGERTHCIIVSEVTKDDILFCGHTYNRVDASFRKFAKGDYDTYYLIKVD